MSSPNSTMCWAREGYAATNPNVVAAVLISSSIDTAGVLIATVLTEDGGVVLLRRTYAGRLTYGLDEEPTILDIARSDGNGDSPCGGRWVRFAGRTHCGSAPSPQGRPSPWGWFVTAGVAVVGGSASEVAGRG
jgi:hypothetical protein